MAKAKKATPAKAVAGHNGFDPDRLRAYVDRVENIQREMEAATEEHKDRCSAFRDDVKEVLAEAKDHGIPTKPLKALLKQRELARKAAACRDNLEFDQVETFDQLRHALGDLEDTPLGQAAMKASGLPGAEAEGTATVQ